MIEIKQETPLTEVVSALTEDIFFNFMEKGRGGITESVPLVIEKFLEFYAFRTVASGRVPVISTEAYQETRALIERTLITGFICGGSKELREEVMKSYYFVMNAAK